MRHGLFLIGGLALSLSGCVSSPRQTVLGLDTTDPRWTSHRCVAARKAVARYDDHALARTAVGLGVGAAMTPLAGAGASLALSAAQDPARARLNRRVRTACISDPLGARHAARQHRRERYANR
jgi:hypothetical protein